MDEQQQHSIITTILNSKSHYEVLSLPLSASTEDIRKSYLRSSRHVHPGLSTAYQTLSNPKTRRMYDSGGCHDYDPLLQQQNWQTCISEVFAEFMNSNYEPVMSALELLNRQTPAGLGVDRDAIRLALSQLRDFIVAGQVRYDLIQPELIQLKQLRSGQRLSIFDILGRMRSSLQMTRVVLQIFRKSLIGPPDSSADESAEEDSGAMMTEGDKENVRSAVFESTVTGNSGVADQQLASPPASTANQPHSITCDCLDGAISILQRAEDGLQSMQSFRKRWLW